MNRYEQELALSNRSLRAGRKMLQADLAAMQSLTDRLAQVERERDELKRGKSCDGCRHWRGKGEACHLLDMSTPSDWHCKEWTKPRDPSTEVAK